ncbi:MAG: hypothetical protein RIR00_52 [Pseudomonadota bacterium]|jgi:adenosylcobinamide-phosphate synthase
MSLPELPALLALPLAALLGVGLDRVFGELNRWHPLVGFGRLAAAVERRMPRRRRAGVVAWAGVVLPWVGLAAGLRAALPSWPALGLDALLLYFALGGRSLAEHAEAIATPLAAGDLPQARQQLSRIVSRETGALSAEEVAKGAVESVLENGNDAVFAALFWFAVAGGPGVVLYRLANTLDAMWGYRTPRFLAFGWAAARIDDALNYLPARLTALSYALFGATANALRCWRRQAPAWDSPNAGPVMATGAGSLGLQLGGAAIYHGQIEQRPPLGAGRPATAADIPRALRLLRRSLGLWLGLLALPALHIWLTGVFHA